tara:strand:+ start:1290 stop:1400 length:111 start_codon:yes stop_codon:yes gene_type:complete
VAYTPNVPLRRKKHRASYEKGGSDGSTSRQQWQQQQ